MKCLVFAMQESEPDSLTDETMEDFLKVMDQGI
jgi:hypothetical protein